GCRSLPRRASECPRIFRLATAGVGRRRTGRCRATRNVVPVPGRRSQWASAPRERPRGPEILARSSAADPGARIPAGGVHSGAIRSQELTLAAGAVPAPAPHRGSQMDQALAASSRTGTRSVLPVALAIGVMAAVSLMTLRPASVVIDHQRYYYLD